MHGPTPVINLGPGPEWLFLSLVAFIILFGYVAYRMICAMPPPIEEDFNAPPPDEESMRDESGRKPVIPVKHRNRSGPAGG